MRLFRDFAALVSANAPALRRNRHRLGMRIRGEDGCMDLLFGDPKRKEIFHNC